MTDEAVAKLLEILQQGQLWLASGLETLGLTQVVHGQAAWPFSQRFAAEQLLFDHGQAKRLIWAACASAALLLMALLMIWWRKKPRRVLGLLLVSLLVGLCTPWPLWALLFAPTVPTVFHHSAVPLTAHSVVRGQQLYQTHCLECHGPQGDGDGALAQLQPVWPPTLNRSLLWKRFEGELFWSVRHGMHDRHGRITMPAADAHISDEEIWDVLHFVRAQSAGQSLQREGLWPFPVRMPASSVVCGHQQRSSDHWRGQTVRVVFPGAEALREDPRLVTISIGTADGIDCSSTDADTRSLLSILTGQQVHELAGYQLLVDRQGWLRALSRAGSGGWSEDDLVCRTNAAQVELGQPPLQDGLQAVIRRMDAEPVRAVVAGFAH